GTRRASSRAPRAAAQGRRRTPTPWPRCGGRGGAAPPEPPSGLVVGVRRVLVLEAARRPVGLGRVAAARAVQRGDVLQRDQDVPVELHVRDVLDVAIRGEHAVLVFAAEERDLDLLALVLVRVVLHAARRAYPMGATSRSSRKCSSRTPQFATGWNGVSLTWPCSARIVPPWVTTRIRCPGFARAIRSTAASTRAACCSRVSPSGRSPPNRSSISSRVRPDHDPTSISRRPASATTSMPCGAATIVAVSNARRR